jgi:hypothetical protein
VMKWPFSRQSPGVNLDPGANRRFLN